MTRGVAKGVVTVSKLKELLNYTKNAEILLPELLKEAKEKNLITLEEFEASCPKDNVVLKCYLKSIIVNPEHIIQLDKYVEAYSLFYTRGSFIMNLLALDKFGPINNGENQVIRYTRNNFQRTKFMYQMIEEDNSILKQCFLHERWPLTVKPNENKKARISEINTIVENNQIPINRISYPTWKSIMCVSGWDNAINNMYTKYRANLQNHIIMHLPESLKKYFDQVEIEEGTNREMIKQLFYKPQRPCSECHNRDFANAIRIRLCVGLESINGYMYKKYNYNQSTFDVSIFLKKYIGHETYFPISTLGRKYAYIDKKIATYLFNDKKSETLAEIIGFTPESFKKKRKLLRNQLRRKYKHKIPNMSESKRKKLKEKWSRIGMSYIPDKSIFNSIETDGVGLSIVLKKNRNLYEKQKHIIDEPIDLKNDKPVVIGMDEGRVKLFAAAISTNPLEKPKSFVFTRHQYYHEIKHKKRKKFELQRSMQPLVQNALLTLALHSKITDLPGYFTTLSNNIEVLKTEYFEIERALWRMRLYRAKKKSLMSAVQKLFTLCEGRPVILGVGDANFKCTGRGEKAVPTTGLTREILKARKRYNNKTTIHSIHEFRTTVCCCQCGCVTEGLMRPNGVRSRRVRFCNSCNQQNVTCLRDRDIQAARNMLWLTQYQHIGVPRPSYLCRTTT